MKVSIISSVLNEERNIEEFVESIKNQTLKPSEFIIVDGGSKDKTYFILKKLSKKIKFLKIFQKKGANISTSRNLAIKHSKSEIIVSIDAGTKYEGNWLKNLTEGFNGQVSFGIEKPIIKNKFQKILAKSILHKGVPGSSRNMIFLKRIWKEVGGYPEDLNIAEDTLFDEKIKKVGYKISKVKNAICYWEMRENLEEVKKQFYNYGYWDGVLQKKYGMLPKKYKILVFLLLVGYIFYPLFWVVSKFSLRVEIDLHRRYNYLNGFLKSYLE